MNPLPTGPFVPARRPGDDHGFTLIELLIAILILGILAAIAVPTFLGQNIKAQDAGAKSDARNLVTHVESCFVDGEDYRNCDSAAELGNIGLSYGTGQGQVRAVAFAADQILVYARSRSDNLFFIYRVAGGTAWQFCVTAGKGGCPAGSFW